MNLIRPQVLAARRDDGLGTIDLTRVRLSWALPGVLFCLLFGALLMASLGQYQRRVQASGQLVSSSGLIELSAPLAGIVQSLHVVQAQPVAEGELLATLFVDTETGEELPVGSKIELVLSQQHSQRQLDLEQARLAAGLEERSLLAGQELDAREAEALAIQRTALESRLGDARAFLERVQGIGRGALSELQLRGYRAEVAGHESALAELRLRELELQRRLVQVRARLAALPIETEQALGRIRREIAELDLAATRNTAARQVELRAARTGVIGEVLVSPGQSVQPGASILQLIPEGGELEAELWLPSEAVGMVREGDSVLLRFPAFPFRSFGLQSGQVRSVARTALSAQQLQGLGDMTAAGPRFRVRVGLGQQRMRVTDGSERELRIGMLVDADLLLERQPIYRALWPERAPSSLAAGVGR